MTTNTKLKDQLTITILYSDLKKNWYIYEQIMRFLDKEGIIYIELNEKFNILSISWKDIFYNGFMIFLDQDRLLDILQHTWSTSLGNDYWKTWKYSYIVKL